ncbi:MAG: alpha/beta hydrolase family protein [Clostridia bacterium]|nr:alpha/beta hydrolase family protein [Clostridia bacterium]
MAFIDLKFYSESLGMQSEVYVVIPQRSSNGEIGIEGKKSDDKYKCLYLLHGLSDDHSIWLRRTSIERYATEYGICVVMPCGGRSFYTDMKYGAKYFTYITEELPGIVREFLNVSDKREDTYIAGLSMGGYGALKSALKKPEVFCACAGLSSVADIRCGLFDEVLVPVFGDELVIPDDEDLFFLADRTNANPQKPRVFMGVGTEDFLYDANQRLKEKMETLDYDFTYRESSGTHCWEFWDEYIQYVLEWMFSE